MTVREKLHRLVEELPDKEVRAADRFLEYLRNVGSDPVLRALMAAPLDDERETEEERAAVAEAYEDLRQGRVQSLGEVERDLGL